MHITEHVKFSKAEATALLKVAHKDATKPQLHGVWIEARQGRAFATDGYRVVVLCSTQDTWNMQNAGEPCLVPRDIWQRALHMVPKNGTLQVRSTWPAGSDGPQALGIGIGTIWLDAIDAHGVAVGSTSCVAPDLKPLPVDHVLPDLTGAPRPSVPCAHMNAAFLADAAAVQKAVRSERMRVTPPAHHGEPWAFTAEGDDANISYIVMAIVADEDGVQLTDETVIAYAAETISKRRRHDKRARSALWSAMTTAAGPGGAVPQAPIPQIPAQPTPEAPPAPKAKQQRRKSKPQASTALHLVQ